MDKLTSNQEFPVVRQAGNTVRRELDVPPPVSSLQLLGTRGVMEILHEGQIYQLRRTATGKLILTK